MPDGDLLIYGRGLPTAAKRFAIAHGLAHLIFDNGVSACRPGFAGDPHVEARADRFAEELLVPLDRLVEYVGRKPSNDPVDHELYLDMVDEISSHFHVPSAVIGKRIGELISRGLIS
jgi:Zn-dependent peptidase ImmA (M78 family)